MTCHLGVSLLALLPACDLSMAVEWALEARCLLVVSINPESRVKAARGPAPAELLFGKTNVVVVKVINEAGVTAPLTVSGPGLGPGEWLTAALAQPSRLRGGRTQYLLLHLTPREMGRREVTFRFDVGQGTQDLGFRAEAPVLFVVKKP